MSITSCAFRHLGRQASGLRASAGALALIAFLFWPGFSLVRAQLPTNPDFETTWGAWQKGRSRNGSSNEPQVRPEDMVIVYTYTASSTQVSYTATLSYKVQSGEKTRQSSDGSQTDTAPFPDTQAGERVEAESINWGVTNISSSPASGTGLVAHFTTPFGVGRLTFTISNLIETTPGGPTPPWRGTQSFTKSIDFHPMEVNCPELYMFSGHAGDKVVLCKASGTCEWKLKNNSPAIGTFDHPTNLSCSFTATTPGKNTIQLVIDGVVVWEKPTEILELKSRSYWGAKPVDPAGMSGTMSPIQGVTYHHSANTNDGIAEIQRIQNEHQGNFPYNFTHENWGDIGYHFIIDKSGTVYTGRELEAAPGSAGGPFTLGAHVKNKNTPSGIGICMLGNYDTEAFTAAHQKDLEKAISAICRRYKLNAANISYHGARAAVPPVVEATNCPGANVKTQSTDIFNHIRENLL